MGWTCFRFTKCSCKVLLTRSTRSFACGLLAQMEAILVDLIFLQILASCFILKYMINIIKTPFATSTSV